MENENQSLWLYRYLVGANLLIFQPLLSTLKDLLVLAVKIIYYTLEMLVLTLYPPKEKDLRGEVAVVTGGGHGIGLEMVRQLTDLGVKIAVWDVNIITARAAVSEITEKKGLGIAVQCDVSDKESVESAVAKTRAELGEVTLLINNAGIMPCKLLLNHSAGDIEKLFKVNVYSHYWTIFEFLPRMLSLDRGHIVCMSSIGGITGTPNLVPYCSSKFALKGLMDGLFQELRAMYPDSKVKTTTIHPFTVDTGLAKKPRTRFNWLIPITSAESAASQTISAIRREYEYSYIPEVLCPIFAIGRLVPRKVQLSMMDFLDCNVEAHE
jgi:all-trans-retinol dehydrogenase (NAD+)